MTFLTNLKTNVWWQFWKRWLVAIKEGSCGRRELGASHNIITKKYLLGIMMVVVVHIDMTVV